MIKSLLRSFRRNIERPLMTLVAALILCAIVGIPAVLLTWGFCAIPEVAQYYICIGLLVLFVLTVVSIVIRSIYKFCRRVWREAKEDYEWHNSHSEENCEWRNSHSFDD